MEGNVYLKDQSGNPLGTATNPLHVYYDAQIGATTLNGLSDVIITLPVEGEVLTYDATGVWKNGEGFSGYSSISGYATISGFASNAALLGGASSDTFAAAGHNHNHNDLDNIDGSTYHLDATAYASVNTWNVAPSNKGVTNGDTHDHIGGDGASIAEGAFAFTDVTTSDSSTTKHGLLIKATSPPAGIRNIVAIDNAETAYKNTALVDNTNPEPLGTASPGTSLVAARRDHVHPLPKGGDLSWSEVTGTTQACAVNVGYILNNAALVTATLPATAAVGDVIRIVGKGAGMWKVAQNASQYIRFAGLTTTTGTSGYLQAENAYDCIEIMCTTANVGWIVISSMGNIVVV